MEHFYRHKCQPLNNSCSTERGVSAVNHAVCVRGDCVNPYSPRGTICNLSHIKLIALCNSLMQFLSFIYQTYEFRHLHCYLLHHLRLVLLISFQESGLISLRLDCTLSYSLFLFVRRLEDCNTNLKLKWMDILILLALRRTVLKF